MLRLKRLTSLLQNPRNLIPTHFVPPPVQSPSRWTSRRFLDIYQLASKSAIEKERARLSDELNRGYFADIDEMKKHGGKIAAANKIIIPAIAAVKFPEFEVNYSNGLTLKLPVASAAKDEKLDIPKASLICLSFRASSQEPLQFAKNILSIASFWTRVLAFIQRNNIIKEMKNLLAVCSELQTLLKLRSGRASPGMLDHIIVESSGVKIPLSRMAVVSVIDPKTLSVTPFDPNTLKELEKAIVSSPLGLNPKSADQRLITSIPPLTKEHMQVSLSSILYFFLIYFATSLFRLAHISVFIPCASEIGVEVSSMSSMAIQNVFEVSRRFELGPDDFSSCVMCLKGLGFSERTVVKVLEAFPMVIMMNKDDIFDKLAFLVMNIGIEKEDLDRIFELFPNVLAFKVESRLNPLLDEFKDLGFGFDVVRREVVREPRVLGLEVGELSQCLKMLRSLKCRDPIKDSIFSSGEFRAGYDVKLRVDFLRKFGLTYRDAFTVLWREPRAILYDIVDLEKKIEFLISTMKFDVLSLVEVPEYLGVSFEKKIVPRYNVIEFLRSRGWLGDEVGLRGLIKPSRLRFYNLYVKPYPECEEIYGRYARNDNGVRRGHPVGMWKLFAPQKHSQSPPDVKSIKSFMESVS